MSEVGAYRATERSRHSLCRGGKVMRRIAIGVFLVVGLAGFPDAVLAQSASSHDQIILGLKIRAGGRYDNVRMCVATPAGVKGGPSVDVSFFMDIGLSDRISLGINVPVVRPLLFGAAFHMLQFEPDVTLNFHHRVSDRLQLVAGPTLGVSLHYGPDFNSERSGDGRGPSFFAMGPTVGGYLGLDFTRPGKDFNFQLGLSPYLTPLFSIGGTDDHRGVVVGGLLDGQFRFTTNR